MIEMFKSYLEDERVLIGLTAATAGLIVKLLSHNKPHHPPGPTVWPVVGSLPSMRNDAAVFKEFAEKYGDIYYLELGLFGSKPTIVISNIELIREALLTKQDDFAGRIRTHTFDLLSGYGADIANGDPTPRWHFQKKLAHTALRKYASGEHLQEMIEHCVEIVSDIFRKSNEKPIDIRKAVSLIFYNIIASMCFGKKYDFEDLEFNQIMGLMNELEEMVSGLSLADFSPPLRHIPTPFQQKLKCCVQKHVHFYDGILREHRENFDKYDVRDLTDLLIQTDEDMKANESANEEIKLEDVHFQQILNDMFFAGTDTSRSTLTWALLFLAVHPEIQEKAQREIDSQIGTETKITSSNRVKIPYCEAIISETLRLRTPGPIAIPHATTCDTSVGGYEVRKGTQIIINLAYMHMDPKVWENPEEFHPERFIDEHGDLAPKPDSYLPFSTGRRQCVGEALAKTELHIILGMLLQRFSFHSTPGHKVNLTPTPNLFLTHPKENEIVVKER